MQKGEFLRHFLKHRVAVVSLIVLAAELLLVIFLPMVMELDPYTTDPLAFKAPPSETHLLGTDTVGRDIFARLIYGGRTSLLIGVASTAISVILGVPLGLLAGYYQGAPETLIMRLADMFMSFPGMILILVVVALFGSGVASITIIIGILGWPVTARLLCANVRSQKTRQYVDAARVCGAGDLTIMVRYILPNSVSPLWMSLAFRISQAMIIESGVSFLGAGIQPPKASWGNIIQEANSIVVLNNRPWIWIPAGLCLMLTIVAINFIGEGIRDALDPKLKRI